MAWVARNSDNTERTPSAYSRHDKDNVATGDPETYVRHDGTNTEDTTQPTSNISTDDYGNAWLDFDGDYVAN